MSYIAQETMRTAAIEYVRRQLREGKSLAKLLLKTVDFAEGNVATLSPTPLNPTDKRLDPGFRANCQGNFGPMFVQMGPFVRRLMLVQNRSACVHRRHITESPVKTYSDADHAGSPCGR